MTRHQRQGGWRHQLVTRTIIEVWPDGTYLVSTTAEVRDGTAQRGNGPIDAITLNDDSVVTNRANVDCWLAAAADEHRYDALAQALLGYEQMALDFDDRRRAPF